MNLDDITIKLEELTAKVIAFATGPDLYAQLGVIVAAVFIASLLARTARKYVPALAAGRDIAALHGMKKFTCIVGEVLFPTLNILMLTLAIDISQSMVEQSWLVRIAVSLAVVMLLYSINARFVTTYHIKMFVKWVVIPVALLRALGWLETVTRYMDSIAIEVGNIHLSAYGIARMLVFGAVLFWLGRISNNTGQQIIRKQEAFDAGTREVFAKLFQVVIIAVVFVLLLQLMGINLTALAVFGGAVGVGLGFGLQSIASNFISGIIILLDRSLTVGDYIELEDGRTGTIRELNMRSAILETFDGKDIMVPNEKFITTDFVNWTHKNKKQRYSLKFAVAYDSDLDLLFRVIKHAVANHPKVLSGADASKEEQPDAEIEGFGDSGINILVEYWMEGIDDGSNRVGADLLYSIWKTLKENNIKMPFPQREVRILNSSAENAMT